MEEPRWLWLADVSQQNLPSHVSYFPKSSICRKGFTIPHSVSTRPGRGGAWMAPDIQASFAFTYWKAQAPSPCKITAYFTCSSPYLFSTLLFSLLISCSLLSPPVLSASPLISTFSSFLLLSILFCPLLSCHFTSCPLLPSLNLEGAVNTVNIICVGFHPSIDLHQPTAHVWPSCFPPLFSY